MPHEMHPVYRSLNKPLTILKVERRLFFMAAIIGAATFNFFTSFSSGLLMFSVLYVCARWATAKDPAFLRIMLNSAAFRVRYDPAKRSEETPS